MKHKHILLALACVVFASCSNKSEPTYRIGLSQCSEDAWRQKMDEEMERELLLHSNMHLSIRSANDNSQLQQLQIDSFIQEKVDLLIVSPNEADGLTDAVGRAYDAGIPVIVADRRINGDKYTAFIGGDNYQVGLLLAEYICDNLPKGGKIVEVHGLEGSTPAVLRHKGMMDGLKTAPNGEKIDIVAHVDGNFFLKNAYEKLIAILPTLGKVDMIIAQNDRMALGAWQAIEEMIDKGAITQADRPSIIGVDALLGKNGGVEAIYEGKLQASVSYATVGDLIIQTAYNILNNQPFQRDTVIPAVLIDKQAAKALMNLSIAIDKEVRTIYALKKHIDIYENEAKQQRLIISLIILFTTFLIGFFFYLLYLYEQRKRLSEQLMAAQQDLERATLSKLTFFTNVSHDFRTPLTLIADPLQQLSSDKTLNSEQHQLARIAQKNSQVLLRLINQTLDFRKYESGLLSLHLSQVNLADALQQWIEAFQPLAYKKHIHLNLEIAPPKTENDYITAIDIEKAERVMFNLVANAFKFTPENGHIDIKMCREQNTLKLSIADDGRGIPNEHKERIFESFYQVDTTNSQGSGIGLTLVKSFVTLQGGTITLADNKPKGTVFYLTLPVNDSKEVPFTVGDGGYLNITTQQILTELDDSDYQNKYENSKLVDAEILSAKSIINTSKEKIMLIIDDNADIRHYLTHLFYKDYTILTAKDGNDGIHKAMIAVPDIIICDVSMPDMDGLEACKRLKTEITTSHIPVLMLTAHSLDEQRISGLEHGADAYMTKPFNAEVLKAQVNTLIENRIRVKKAFTKGEETTTNIKQDIATPEQLFVNKFNKIIKENLNDENLSVEQIADKMAMSRTQLYRKIKQLTNYSPNELIRNTRLEEARKMLMKGDKNISEVAYDTGFTSPSYFTKCYVDYFGEKPSEANNKKQNNNQK